VWYDVVNQGDACYQSREEICNAVRKKSDAIGADNIVRILNMFLEKKRKKVLTKKQELAVRIELQSVRRDCESLKCRADVAIDPAQRRDLEKRIHQLEKRFPAPSLKKTVVR